MSTKILRVKKWETFFESAKSKDYNVKSQTYCPNKFGLGYCYIMSEKDGPAIFGTWHALICYLSQKTKPRSGYLTDNSRSTGTPYTADDLSMALRIDAATVKRMLTVCQSQKVGWLEFTHVKDTIGNHGSESVPPPLPLPPPSPPPSLPDSDSVDPQADATAGRKKSFKQWTSEEFMQEIESANHDGILTPDEAKDFHGYWTEQSASGRFRMAMEKTWNTRRRMQTAIRMVYDKQRAAGRSKGGKSNLINTWHSKEADKSMEGAF